MDEGQRRIAALILVGAVLMKLALIFVFFDRVYYDVFVAVNVGRGFLDDPGVYHITNKTWLGPALWSLIYGSLGLTGLKLANLLFFAVACAIQAAIGRERYSGETTCVALFLFAFYPGANLNVVAGEQDDTFTVLLLALGVLLYLRHRRLFLAALVMGTAAVFKLSAGIYAAGFLVYVLLAEGFRPSVKAAMAVLLPFLLLNFIDGFASLTNLASAFDNQSNSSDWKEISFKLFSTGLLPSVAIGWWMFRRGRTERDLFFALVPTMYLLYVLVNSDAFSAGYVMMLGMIFSAFPLAGFLLHEMPRPGLSRRAIVVIALTGYMLASTVITLHNLSHDPEHAFDPQGQIHFYDAVN